MIDNKSLEQIRYYPLPFRIKKLRLLTGLSQTEFGEKINISQTTISMWEKGRSEPSERSLERIVKAYELPFDFFLDIDVQRLE